MATGILLIAVILILGGVIATVGDRIGTKVGKARLSLFNLRPKKTAVVVTILTGSLVSATTLAILFAIDDGLRTGVFELEDIQKDLKRKRESLETTRQQLNTTNKQKSQVEQQLAQARTEQKNEQIAAQKRQAEAQRLLQATNESLQATQNQQKQTLAELRRTTAQKDQAEAYLQLTQNELQEVSKQFQQARTLLQNISQQAKTLRQEIKERQDERQRLIRQVRETIAKRDALIASLDRAISERDGRIAKLDEAIQTRDRNLSIRDAIIRQREALLKELEQQQNYLSQEVSRLEQYYESYRDLRLGKLALVRGQLLIASVVRVQEAAWARQAVEELLGQANRSAIAELAEPGSIPNDTKIVKLPEEQFKQLAAQIDDGQSYVVRVFSAGNYVRGEKQIQVFADAVRNQVVFTEGEVVASATANPKSMTANELRQQLDLLLFKSQFRARHAGILEDSILIGDGRPETFFRFIDQVRQFEQPLDIVAVAATDTYTSGPLKVQLVAMQNGQIVFRT